jgi:hypothetical protein
MNFQLDRRGFDSAPGHHSLIRRASSIDAMNRGHTFKTWWRRSSTELALPGRLKHLPTSWKDMFFTEARALKGS